MKICLVTAFPPSRRGLNEYGFHIARELQRDPLLSVTILADELEPPQPELPDFSVERCWSFNALQNPQRLLPAIRDCQPDVVWFNLLFSTTSGWQSRMADCQPDVVWFNLLFSTFGDRPLPAFFGLGIPAMTRAAGS